MTAERLASRAELVLDPRLAEVWQLIWSRDPDPEPFDPADSADSAEPVSEVALAALLRLAYVVGYADALDESDRGALYRELGVRTPKATGMGAPRRGPRRRLRSSGS